jgi:sterol desaturase/sphingolipid hydroxylase (fatty acid hydroxylase superfamily)
MSSHPSPAPSRSWPAAAFYYAFMPVYVIAGMWIAQHGWATIATVAVVTMCEQIHPLDRRVNFTLARELRLRSLRDLAENLYFLLLNPPLMALLGSITAAHLDSWLNAHLHAPPTFLPAMQHMPLLAQAFVALIAMDFFFYWMHRGYHNVGLLWRLHASHHSSQTLTSLRLFWNNPLQITLENIVLAIPMSFVPVSERALVLAGAFRFLITLLAHANLRVWCDGPVGWLFVTRRTHGIHHSADIRDKGNYADVFIVFDRLFGTCIDAPHDADHFEIGIAPNRPRSLIHQFFYPLYGRMERY